MSSVARSITTGEEPRLAAWWMSLGCSTSHWPARICAVLPRGDDTDQPRFFVGFAFEELRVALPHGVAERPGDDPRDLGAEMVVDGELRPAGTVTLLSTIVPAGRALDLFGLAIATRDGAGRVPRRRRRSAG